MPAPYVSTICDKQRLLGSKQQRPTLHLPSLLDSSCAHLNVLYVRLRANCSSCGVTPREAGGNEGWGMPLPGGALACARRLAMPRSASPSASLATSYCANGAGVAASRVAVAVVVAVAGVRVALLQQFGSWGSQVQTETAV